MAGGNAAYTRVGGPMSVGWRGKQWDHARLVLGDKIDDYATAGDFVTPGSYTLIGAMARQNKGKGRVISTGTGGAQAMLGAADTVSIMDNPLAESWYLASRLAVMISPSATVFIDPIKLNGVASGVVGIRLEGSVSQTKFKIYTFTSLPVVANFAASVGTEIQLGVDYDFGLAYDAPAGRLTAYLNQQLQATLTDVSQLATTVANVQHFQLLQTGVAECDDLFYAFKR